MAFSNHGGFSWLFILPLSLKCSPHEGLTPADSNHCGHGNISTLAIRGLQFPRVSIIEGVSLRHNAWYFQLRICGQQVRMTVRKGSEIDPVPGFWQQSTKSDGSIRFLHYFGHIHHTSLGTLLDHLLACWILEIQFWWGIKMNWSVSINRAEFTVEVDTASILDKKYRLVLNYNELLKIYQCSSKQLSMKHNAICSYTHKQCIITS